MAVPVWYWALFIFIFGSCVGSFLNVVVWRTPRGGSIFKPAQSYCPKCNTPIRPWDNIPLLSWVLLRGRCRKCCQPISVRYPIVEGLNALIWLGLFVGVFAGPLRPDLPAGWPGNWPALVATFVLVSVLLAGSLIDLEFYFIPLRVIWVAGVVGVIFATIWPGTGLPMAGPDQAAWAVGGAGGLLLSIVLLSLGVLPLSFPEEGEGEEPQAMTRAQKKDLKAQRRKEEKRSAKSPDAKSPGRAEAAKEKSPADREGVAVTVGARREVLKELLFLAPPVVGGILWHKLTSAGGSMAQAWGQWCQSPHLLGAGGALFGLLIGGLVIWAVRILGTLGFGKEAMGLGDVHLLASAGAVTGWAGATLAFFVAPFFGLAVGIVMLLRKGKKELPYGPYLSMAIVVLMLYEDRFVAWLGPGMRTLFGGGG